VRVYPFFIFLAKKENGLYNLNMAIKTVKTVKKAEKTSETKKPAITGDDLLSAIKDTFPNIEGKIYLCHLWVEEDVHRFRINWYKDGAITHSKFLHVRSNTSKKTKNKLIIEEKGNVHN
jgi:hypothetical protein